MTYGDYRRLETELGSGRASALSLSGYSDWATPRDRESVTAIHGASWADGRFPLVLYAPSFSAPAWENSDLCEFLASYGYAVVASASQGPVRRAMTSSKSGLYAQSADLSFLLHWARKTLPIAVGPVAVAGYSWGGYAGLIAAAVEPQVGAMVSLDGSFQSFGALLEGASVADLTRDLPVLSIVASGAAESAVRVSSNPESSGGTADGGLAEIFLSDLCHADLSTLFQRDDEVRTLHLDPWHLSAGRSRSEVEQSLRSVADLVRRFIDSRLLAETPTAQRRLTGLSQAIKRDMEISGNQDLDPFPTLRDIIQNCAFTGFGKEVAALLSAAPVSAALEEQVLEWIRDLIAAGRFHQARRVAGGLAKLCPSSDSLLIGLGEADHAACKPQRARAAFGAALGSDSDFDARRWLARLERAPSVN